MTIRIKLDKENNIQNIFTHKNDLYAVTRITRIGAKSVLVYLIAWMHNVKQIHFISKLSVVRGEQKC